MRRRLIGLCALTLLAAALPANHAGAARDGDNDPSFGTGGFVTTSIGSVARANSVAVQRDGKIVVAGFIASGSSPRRFAVLRYTSSGVLDPTFEHDGIATTSVGKLQDAANAVAIQPDGKIVVAGITQVGSDTFHLAVVRYTAAGAADPTFGNHGIATLGIGSEDTEATAVAVQRDGKIVVAGEFLENAIARFAVVRYTAAGRLDPTFDHDGIQAGTTIGTTDVAKAVALLPNNEIAVGGWSTAASPDFAVAVYQSNGSLDPHFGVNGIVTTDIFGEGQGDLGDAIAVQPDGRILLAGYRGSPGSGVVARYTSTGALDATFGTDGIASFFDPVAGDTTAVIPVAIALQPDGKIVLGGTEGNPNGRMAAYRLTRSGHLDYGFGSSGVVLAGAVDTRSFGVAVPYDAKIVVAGGVGPGGGTAVAIARFNGDKIAPWGARVLGLPAVSLGPQAMSWLASDTGSGVRSFDVRRRSAKSTGSTFGAWTMFRSATTNVVDTLPFGPPGTTECVEVRGRDYAGNVGAYGAPTCTSFPVDDRALSLHGAWTRAANANDYLGTETVSKTFGAVLTTTVSARRLGIVVTRCPGCGSVEVKIDNNVIADVGLGSSKTYRRQVISFDFGSVLHGTVSIEVHSSGHPVIIDGLVVDLT